MSKTDCKFEPVSNITIGILLMIVGLMFTLVGIVIIPVVGLLIAVPVLLIAGVFLASPRSKACAIIAEKTRAAVKN